MTRYSNGKRGYISSADRPDVNWNAERSFNVVFEEQVERIPDSPALKTENQEFNYYELNAYANRIANAVLDVHDDRFPTVAVITSHGSDTVAGIMGVAKSGLASVCLNAAYHDQGLIDLIKHSTCGVILTDATNFSRIVSLASSHMQVIDVGKISKTISGKNLDIAISPDSLAQIKYTSGSTGHPKGVTFTHRAAVHGSFRGIIRLDLKEGDRVALFEHLWIWAIGGTLFSGGCLFPSRLQGTALARTGSWLEQNHITKCPAFPTAFRQFAASSNQVPGFSAMKRIFLAGESIFQSDFDLFKEHFGYDCEFAIGFGMTEIGGGTSTYLLHKDDRLDGETLPAGYAHTGLEFLILDDNLEVLSSGEIGQIAVKSRFSSSGYWHDPELTAKRYLPDPDGSDATLFLTGDLGFLNENGCLFLKGRKDEQIKIRNHRLVPPDIEGVLLSHLSVKSAAVTTFENDKGDVRLAGYVVFQDQTDCTTADIRNYLKKSLPEFMVPSVFMPMEALPLRPTGKIDYGALPKPKNVVRDDNTDFVVARTELEVELTSIWQGLLGLSGIGVEDNFFDLGGDSLQATRLILELGLHYQVEIDAETMFKRASTIAGMAQVIEAVNEGPARKISFSVRTAPRDVDFVDFNVKHNITTKSELFYIDPKIFLRLARPNTAFGPIIMNSMGFRSPEIEVQKPPGTVRLAFLGHSATYDPQANSNETTWPYLVWKELQTVFPNQEFDFVNTALPGYKSRDMTLVFQHIVSKLDPDIVIIGANDMNVDTSHRAREMGIYSGVHYSPSLLAKRSAFWAALEKQLVIYSRLCLAQSERDKLHCDLTVLSRNFEQKLENLVRVCQSSGAQVALLTNMGRLAPGQSRWQCTRASVSHVFYMPYLSVMGLNKIRIHYWRVVSAVAKRMKCLEISAREAVPADGRHYADSNHFRKAGSQRMAKHVAGALAKLLES